jgi:hypothetical protein
VREDAGIRRDARALSLKGGAPHRYLGLLVELAPAAWAVFQPVCGALTLHVSDDRDVEEALRAAGFDVRAPTRVDLGPLRLSGGVLVATASTSSAVEGGERFTDVLELRVADDGDPGATLALVDAAARRVAARLRGLSVERLEPAV